MRCLRIMPSLAGWQQEARQALGRGWTPEEVVWEENGGSSLPIFSEGEEAGVVKEFRVPRAFLDLAGRVACHRNPQRWAILYRTLWRLTHGEPHLLEIVVDRDVHQLLSMDKAVRRDVHKMRAFVRFRSVEREGKTWYVAWFEPEHHIVERNAPFFVGRFAGMCWSILTPDRCAHWDGKNLAFTEGVPRSAAPTEDSLETLWITYYRNIFNPARVKVDAMTGEMPKKYWKNLPEAAVIPALLEEAPQRVAEMMKKSAMKSDSGESLCKKNKT